MKASAIPTKIDIPFATGAGGSYIRTIPDPSQIGITPGAASWTDGFPPLNFEAVALGGTPPFGQDMNGVLNAISAWSRWACSGAPVNWDSVFSSAIGGYPKGAVVQSPVTFGTFWVCTADDNTSNPDTGGANWVTLASLLLGAGQAWSNVLGSRAFGVTYYNTTGAPIKEAVVINTVGSSEVTITVGGVVIEQLSYNSYENKLYYFEVPNGASYVVTLVAGPAYLTGWNQLA